MERLRKTGHPHALAAREARRADAYAIGIDVNFIAVFVAQFYASIREDEMLGPIFGARIEDWPVHLAQMNRFWQSILLGTASFSGSPMVKHLAIPDLTEAHFAHWLELFYATIKKTAPTPEAAELVGAKARMIAESLLTGIAMSNAKDGELPGRINLPAY